MRPFLIIILLFFFQLAFYCQSSNTDEYLYKWQDEKINSIKYFDLFASEISDTGCKKYVNENHLNLCEFVLDTAIIKYNINFNKDTLFVIERIIHNSSISAPIRLLKKVGTDYLIYRFSAGDYDFNKEERRTVSRNKFENKLNVLIRSNILDRYCYDNRTLFISRFESGKITCYPMYSGFDEDLFNSLFTN